MKKFISLLYLFIFLTGCSSTFNNKEYKVLTDIKTYNKYEVNYHSTINNDSYSTLNVTFNTHEELQDFVVFEVNEQTDLSVYFIGFTLFNDAFEHLNNSSFFENIDENDRFIIYASNYKQKNSTTYRYILSIEYDNVTYLTKDDGMQYIKNYLDNNRSPFFN